MWNDKETDIDLLGHEKIATTILSIIEDQHLRPLTIGIYGDWGVGKSSILSLLQSQSKATTGAKVYNHHCIMFNGWLFQGYEDAKTALMETVLLELMDQKTLTEKGIELAKGLFKRINWMKVAKVAVGTGLTLATGLPVAGFWGGLFDKAKEEVKPGEDEAWLKEKEEEASVTKQIRAFREEFAKLIKESKVDHVIIMIDDLDRCLPKTVIEILEAIRLLLFVEGTTFVISADERMIEYAVREHFPNLPLEYKEYTRNYLEKLVQVPVRMPTLTSLQTGNYIKLLLIQFYLEGDKKAQLQSVLSAYERKKRRPYDNIALTDEIVKEALGDISEVLKKAILVADQITPTLSAHLRGNPRNIKRFLNTLFLRLRIAQIYGLEAEIQLSMLAKLMLLERFHPAYYDNIVAEVLTDPNGHSKSISDLEANTTGGGDPNADENVSISALAEWAQVDPKFGTQDLRPYIFISKEKAISFASGDGLGDAAMQVYERMGSGSDFVLKAAEKSFLALSPAERSQVFDKLLSDSRSVEHFATIPHSIKGLTHIVQMDSSFEEKLLSRIEVISPEKLGPWCISEFSGLQTELGKRKFRALLVKWQTAATSAPVKALARQTLSKL